MCLITVAVVIGQLQYCIHFICFVHSHPVKHGKPASFRFYRIKTLIVVWEIKSLCPCKRFTSVYSGPCTVKINSLLQYLTSDRFVFLHGWSISTDNDFAVLSLWRFTDGNVKIFQTWVWTWNHLDSVMEIIKIYHTWAIKLGNIATRLLADALVFRSKFQIRGSSTATHLDIE